MDTAPGPRVRIVAIACDDCDSSGDYTDGPDGSTLADLVGAFCSLCGGAIRFVTVPLDA